MTLYDIYIYYIISYISIYIYIYYFLEEVGLFLRDLDKESYGLVFIRALVVCVSCGSVFGADGQEGE